MEAGLVAKVRLEEGIPKLLVKVSPVTAANNAKNLGEVSLRKHGVAVARSHVAVVHISAQVPQGVVLISTKLAELLEVTEGEQVHIARSERVSRHTPGKEEVLGGSMRHQSKMGSVPPEVKARMPWTEQSPLFIQPDRVAPRRTVHGGRLFQAKPEEMEPPPHQRVISRSFSNQMHVPQQTFHPPGQRPMPSPKATYPYAYMPQTRSVTQCHAPGTARPSAKLIPGAKVASPKVQSARSRPYEAQPADWLPSSFAVYQRPPPSSPPALIPRKAESRSPSPPRTPLRTYEKSPAASPPAPAAFVRSVSEDAASSPSPPLLTRMVRPQAKQYPKEAQVYYPPMRMVSAPRAEVKVVERRRSTDRPLLEPGTIPSPCESPPERCPEPPERPQIRLSSMPVTQTQSERRGSQLLRHETIERPLQAAEDVERPIPSREDRESKVLPPLPSFPPPADGVAAVSRGGSKEMALVPVGPRASERRGMRYKSLGALQCESQAPQGAELAGLDASWRPPSRSAGGSLERSELGGEITVEVRRWLHGGTSGLQCSHVVMDKALTVLSNFKLSSGCELEVLGGPLGAIIGGYNEEDWLYQEIFSKAPGQALKDAFELLGFPAEGDWSNYMVEEISLAYRRQCLRGHPSRGGSARHYLKLQVAMELVRAFGSEDDTSPRHGSFVLDDVALARELHLSPGEAAQEADQLPTERLEEINRALDEYILRQMCFKSEIVAEIARLHENSAYSILGVSPDASDSEIKKAYRLVAMQCHPDKGGDKAEFQELHEAYEKIMEQRRSSANLEPAAEKVEPKEKEKEPEEPKVEKEEAEEAEVEEESAPGDEEEDGTDAQLLAKSAKAAEEASRYAKTAADFAHQAAEAAETARNGAESNALALTKSIAHSAIVLTLTVVKAVRVVGYATMDVAAQCRLAARKFQDEKCTECSTEAMGLGLEALNAALSCAEVTEVTAAELSREDANAEGYVGAAVSASLAAASASNAAMSAAIAAVEGNRQCIQAAQPANPDPEPEETSPRSASERSERSEPKVESPEDAGLKRQLTQRNNNHKVLQRLNAEILTHQQNVRQFLQANRQLIPEVSCEAKGKVQKLLQDYAREVQQQIQRLDGDLSQELPGILKGSGLLAPLLQGHVLAIPVCPKARVLKMATLYDLQSTLQVIDEEIFEPARLLLAAQGQDLGSFEELVKQVHEELRSYTEGA